jgi:GT2 family glycosyltransferase
LGAASTPALTVAIAICTRERPEDLVRAVASALRNAEASEIVVVDQSRSDESRRALERQGAFGDLRFHFVHTPGAVGLSRSRNVALAHCTSSVIAFTDDDCVLPSDWVTEIHRQFSADPSLGILFAPVLVPPELADAGFTPSYEPSTCGRVVLEGDPVNVFGLGANMSIRRSAFERVGPFDEELGAGAPLFKAGEDTDYGFRAINLRIGVSTAPSPTVLHYGVRADADSRALRRNYVLGMTGYLGKHARLSNRVARKYLQQRFATLFSEMVKHTVTRGRPSGLNDLRWLVEGIIASRRHYDVDRDRQLYVPRAD